MAAILPPQGMTLPTCQEILVREDTIPTPALTSVSLPYLMELVLCQIVKAFILKMFGTCSSLSLANSVLCDTSRRRDAQRMAQELKHCGSLGAQATALTGTVLTVGTASSSPRRCWYHAVD